MEFIEAMLEPFGGGAQRRLAMEALRDKSPHSMRLAAGQAGLSEQLGEKLAALCALAGPFTPTVNAARALSQGIAGTEGPLDELEALCARLAGYGASVQLRLDFSLINDVEYYNGLIFQGYVNGVSRQVLSGGRYDSLLRRFGKNQGAVGFALYLDALGRALKQAEQTAPRPEESAWLNVALPKGRLGNKVYALLEQAGLSCRGALCEGRKLVFEDEASRVRYFLVKPSDVDIYVEHGAADIGVVGKDVLLESGADVLELMDLGLGRCRVAVAGRAGFRENPARPLRVATKYPSIARMYYAAQSRSVEIIRLHGSIELAPLLGLADVIVDIVETGATLSENDLAVLTDIAPSSARLIANRAAWRFKQRPLTALTTKLRELI
jgi:ATP phosphoribosyltransferase regulatory subunit